MHVEICDVSCVLVKTVKTQKQIKYKKTSLVPFQTYTVTRSGYDCFVEKFYNQSLS